MTTDSICLLNTGGNADVKFISSTRFAVAYLYSGVLLLAGFRESCQRTGNEPVGLFFDAFLRIPAQDKKRGLTTEDKPYYSRTSSLFQSQKDFISMPPRKHSRCYI